LQEKVLKEAFRNKRQKTIDFFNTVKWIPKYCGVFTPCKNCNIETRSYDYATVDEAVFSPCWGELWRIPSPCLLPGNSYKHFDNTRVGKGHMTVSAATSRVSTVTQQLKRFPRVRSRVYRSSQWEIAVSSREQTAAEGLELEKSWSCELKTLSVSGRLFSCVIFEVRVCDNFCGDPLPGNG
jgi:hypothetical protein